MSEQCQNCGSILSDSFYRVFYPDDAVIKECPFCPDQPANGFNPYSEA